MNTGKTPYSYRVWATGKTWACHAKGVGEWFRAYGFETQRDAEFWGLDAIAEFGRNDSLITNPVASKRRSMAASGGSEEVL